MRTIAVVTGTRADYGLLRSVLREIKTDPNLSLRLMVTGAHLSPHFGLTCREIEDDGFEISDRIDLRLGGDTPADIARAMSCGIIGFAEAFEKARPDIVVILGDRYELLSVAQAAMLFRIPLAHIHGGELTQGAFDDAIRHSLTKMSHFHFVAAEPYRNRVIQLGESPERVFNFGSPGDGDLASPDLPSVAELERDLGIKLDGGYFLGTYHPATLGVEEPGKAMTELLAAFDRFPAIKIIMTGVNADPGNQEIAALLNNFAQKNLERVRLETSLGRRRYLGAMKHALAVIGNSSSGVIEAPAFAVPSVNIGDRQLGRLRAPSVIDCAEDRDAIFAAICRALSPEFRAALSGMQSVPRGADAAHEIVRVLREARIGNVLQKTFCDIAAPE